MPPTRRSASRSTRARSATSDADDATKAQAQKDAADAIAGPLEVYRTFFLRDRTFIGGDSPSIADIRLAATLEFLRAIDYELPDWAEQYMTAMETSLGDGIRGAGGRRARLHRLREVAGSLTGHAGAGTSDERRRSAVVFGARNLGKAVIDLLLDDGWAVVGAAVSDATLDGVSAAGGLALRADVTDAESVRGVLAQAADAHGNVDLVVNAASAYGGDRSGPFGGGPIAQAGPDAFDAWAAAPARAAFSFLSATGAFLLEQGTTATVIQVTGGSSRRAAAGRGLWAAGAFGVRAITQASALELREHGIHVALLIVDAGIEPLAGASPGQPVDALADPRDLAAAVRFLADQSVRGATHELQVTPLAERWVP